MSYLNTKMATSVMGQILRNAVVRASLVRTMSRTATSVDAVPSSSDTAAKTPLLKRVETKENSQGILNFTWGNGLRTSFSSVFLRDCCRCPVCYNAAAKQRMLDTVAVVPLTVQPRFTDIDADNVRVTWVDGHVSCYSHDFLWQVHANTSQHDETYDIRFIKPTLWTAKEMSGKIPTFDFYSVLDDDAVKYDWFQHMSEFGVTLLQGTGRKNDALDRFKQLFGGYFKSTHYGETFAVETKPDPSSLAYTPQPVLPHVDLPHYEYTPGIQALHCIDQFLGPGGESTLVDGFNVAKQLKEVDRQAYDVMTSYKITYRDVGSDFFGEYETFYERPVIEITIGGEISKFAYSNWLRDYRIRGSAEEIHAFYESYYKLTHIINDPSNMLKFKMNEGEIICFDNKRLLHGRTAMEGEVGGIRRYLHGCYFDWDGLYTHIRPVKRRLDHFGESPLE